MYHKPTSYKHLRVFGSTCYPNLSATPRHELAPRSTKCVFLGYPSHHKGYCCLELANCHIIISHHVVFDETEFPFTTLTSSPFSAMHALSLIHFPLPSTLAVAFAPSESPTHSESSNSPQATSSLPSVLATSASSLPPQATHAMVTCSRDGTRCPKILPSLATELSTILLFQILMDKPSKN